MLISGSATDFLYFKDWRMFRGTSVSALHKSEIESQTIT